GQSLLELAIVLPILMALVIGIFEFGRAWNVRQVMTNSAREGARFAVIPGTPQDQVEQRVRDRMQDASLPDSLVSVVIVDSDAFASEVSITVQYPYTFQFLGPIVSFLGGNAAEYGTINLSTTSTMRHE
nr:pilus assembly protein [Gemmatimonadota bacterium]